MKLKRDKLTGKRITDLMAKRFFRDMKCIRFLLGFDIKEKKNEKKKS